jgi:hypothetical protein
VSGQPKHFIKILEFVFIYFFLKLYRNILVNPSWRNRRLFRHAKTADL